MDAKLRHNVAPVMKPNVDREALASSKDLALASCHATSRVIIEEMSQAMHHLLVVARKTNALLGETGNLAADIETYLDDTASEGRD